MAKADLQVSISITKQLGPGQPSRGQSMGFRVPADGNIGLVLTANQKSKLGAALEQLGTVVDGDQQDL